MTKPGTIVVPELTVVGVLTFDPSLKVEGGSCFFQTKRAPQKRSIQMPERKENDGEGFDEPPPKEKKPLPPIKITLKRLGKGYIPLESKDMIRIEEPMKTPP